MINVLVSAERTPLALFTINKIGSVAAFSNRKNQACLAILQKQVAGSRYAAPLDELENALNGFEIDVAMGIAQRLRTS